MSGSEILNGRGLLETIALADRALEAERQLAEMKDIELVRCWAYDVIRAASDFELTLYRRLMDDHCLRANIPDQERRKYVTQKMAAEFLAKTIMDACKGASLNVTMNHANDSMSVTFTMRDHTLNVPNEPRWRGAW